MLKVFQGGLNKIEREKVVMLFLLAIIIPFMFYKLFFLILQKILTDYKADYERGANANRGG